MLKNKKTIIALSLIPQYALVKVLAHYPEFVETYYSKGLYPIISKIFRYVLGWLPFSFGDLLYALALIYAVRWLFKNRKRFLKDTKQWFVDVFAAVSLMYFAFHLFWGLNYHRMPLHENLNLNHDYTTEQLVFVTKKLIEKSNAYHLKITHNDTLKVDIPYSKSNIFKRSPNGYNNLKRVFPHLEYHPPSIKKSLFSYPLTYMGFSGYLNPLTNEAQVDALIPVFRFPTTTAHEMAHQLGYAAENEANFIGFVTAFRSENLYFKYSASLFALHYLLNDIRKIDREQYQKYIGKLNKGILKNYTETQRFWLTYENKAEPIFKATYDSFLKANNQKKGIESYNFVVSLLVNYPNHLSEK